MKTDSDIKRSFLRYAIVATAVFAVFLLVKKDNVIRWIQAGFMLGRQERRIEMFEKKNAELDRTIRSMTDDRDTLEAYAREELLFAAPGDDVYIVK